MIGADPQDPGERLELEVERIARRLTALGPARLDEPVVARVREVLQTLADRAADAEGQPRRAVPHLAPHALGDQLAVLARDLVTASRYGDPRLADAADLLAGLRRSL